MRQSKDPSALVIDDEYLIALDAAETLGELGIRVTAKATSFDQAVEQIEREPPDFAVLDLNLGQGDEGERLIPLLAANGCACLVVSADLAACERVRRRFPQWPILVKPVPKRQIKQAVSDLAARTGHRPVAKVAISA